jgi:C terminal of Calcineurin-like phosphoesterase/N terminal of Calcineurin-like phosphoesterase/Calcineurin-like phosphoesterase
MEKTRSNAGITRRDILVGAAGGLAATLAPASAAQAEAATISGVVFEDRSGTGRRATDDPGLAGVLVSNGKDVAVTDSLGHYTLPLPEEATIFVIKPAGFTPPVDPQTMLPRFYAHHRPKGSPEALNLAFEGIAPTAPLPASLDFGLRRQEEPKTFEVALFTDPQPETDVEVDYIRDDVVDALIGTKAKFGIVAGDIMFDDLSLYDRYNRIIATLGLPWWSVGGNHDLNFEAPDRRYSRETFKRVYGPNYLAFYYADALFLLLDDVDYLGADKSKPHMAGNYQGRIDADQLEFVGNVLAHTPPEKLIVAVMHIPLRNDLDPEDPSTNLTNRDEFFALFDGRRFTVSFSGHTHTTEHHYFDAADGWRGPTAHHHHVMTAVSGSWWSGPLDHRGVACADSRDGSPNGFHVLAVDGNTYRTWFVPAKEPNGRQIRISVDSRFHGEGREALHEFLPGRLLTSPIPVAAAPSALIVANVFDGGPKTEVVMTIGNREPIEMARKRMPDPFVQEVFARNEATKKPWVKAEPSSHIWTARLPNDLGVGTYSVAVEAITEYGDKVRGRIALEVTG